MDIKALPGKFKDIILKYKYALLIAAIGLVFLLVPGNQEEKLTDVVDRDLQTANRSIDTEMLTDILQSIQGAGKVKVMLSFSSGEEYINPTTFPPETQAGN